MGEDLMKRFLLLLPLMLTLSGCVSAEQKKADAVAEALKQKIKDLEDQVEGTMEILDGQMDTVQTTRPGSREFCAALAVTQAGYDSMISSMRELAVAYELDGDQVAALKAKSAIKEHEASRIPDLSHICP